MQSGKGEDNTCLLRSSLALPGTNCTSGRLLTGCRCQSLECKLTLIGGGGGGGGRGKKKKKSLLEGS